jgi:hypothetical protein
LRKISVGGIDGRGGRDSYPRIRVSGPKILQAEGASVGGTAASGCCMVDTGAGPELRLRSGQGQAKGRPAPGPSGGKWGWCTPAARVGTMVRGKSKAPRAQDSGQEVAANVWRGLRHPRMRDKGGTLTLTLHPGRSCEMAHLSKALWRNWGILEGSITPTGAGKGQKVAV